MRIKILPGSASTFVTPPIYLLHSHLAIPCFAPKHPYVLQLGVMADPVQVGPCLECGKPTTTLCSLCRQHDKIARFCDRDCQKAAWKKHKPSCGPRDAPKKSTEPKKTPFSFGKCTASQFLAIQGIDPTVPWWQGLNADRQHERFLMSFQFRNEDAYMYGGEFLGPYNVGSNPHVEFLNYYRAALSRDLLPSSCKGAFANSAYAMEHCAYAIEKVRTSLLRSLSSFNMLTSKFFGIE